MQTGEGVYKEVVYQDIIRELGQFSTLKALYESDFYRAKSQALFWMLGVPQPYLLPDIEPRVRDFVRVVQWNIEKGKCFQGLVETFSQHPILKYADLIFLNEVDDGMARSGNRYVARELGTRLGMHLAFAPAHIELTKGTGDDVGAPGENQAAIQGNALLSRYRLGQLRMVELPTCFEPFEFEEKRFGRRIALVAEVDIHQKLLTAVATHLEVRTTPRGRARQMKDLLQKLDRLGLHGPALLAGDLNSSSFPRGTPWRTCCALAKLLLSRPDHLMQSLLCPDRHRREPALALLKQHGFSLSQFNSHQATQRSVLTTLNESSQVPTVIKNWVLKKLDQYDHALEMKLDWIAGRSVEALTANQVKDSKSGISSIDPQVIRRLSRQGRSISDHDPIVADIKLA